MRRCQRQFGYRYIVAAHGSSGRRREAYLLKQLQHFSAWQGSVVHEVLATELLQDLLAARKVSVPRLTSAAEDLAARQFAFSAAKRYREEGQSKRAAGDEFCALFEHEYGRPLPDQPLDGLHRTARKCFERLAAQREFVALLESGSEFESELTLNFRLDEATVAATFDLAFRTAGRRLAIIDWKVAASETSDYTRQLLLYALVAVRSGHWPALRVEDIDLYEANLIRDEVRTLKLTEGSLAQAEDFVYRGIIEMRALSEAADPDDLSELGLAGSPMTCLHCNHAPMCVEDLAMEGHQLEAIAVQGHLLL